MAWLAKVIGSMPKPKPQPQAAQQVSPPAASQESAQASVIAERRKFPRELPKPDVVELDSDSAWQAFQATSGAEPERPLQEIRDSAGL